MKHLGWCLTAALLLSSVSAALAGPNAGGTLVAHDASLLYEATDGDVSICGQGAIPPDCASIDARIDGVHAGPGAVFKVYAAFLPGTTPRLMGITWGVDYPSDRITIAFSGLCGDFELNDPDWPAPQTGSSVTWDVVQTGLLTAVYWFSAYNYAGVPASFALRGNPDQGGGYFGDDEIPAHLDPIDGYGAMGFDTDGSVVCPTGTTGACCRMDGSCFVTIHAGCSAPDQWLGPGTVCSPNPCAQPGACCHHDGSCTVTFESQCAPPNVWQGPNTSCTPNPCPQPSGACCFGDGTCQVLVEAECQQQGGTWLGMDTSCTPNPCPQPGACCLSDGTCTITFESQCTAPSAWQGPNTSCTPNPCPQPGACCHHDGTCTITFESDCPAPDVWQGPNTACTPNPCPQPSGACCFSGGICQVLTQADCQQQGGAWLGMDTVCSPNPCAVAGACCLSDGTCIVTFVTDCSGVWQGGGTVCEPNPCPQPGACCHADGTCTITFESLCVGHWMGPNTTCTPNPCPQLGACCLGLVCRILTQAECDGTWMGAGTICSPNPCCGKSLPNRPPGSPGAPPASAIGSGQGVVRENPPRTICPGSILESNDDGSYENGYAWAYNGEAVPYYGAWAEGYSLHPGQMSVCGVKLALTQIGNQDGWVMDVYVWDASGSDPNHVLSVTPCVDPGPIGMWPVITQHDVDIQDVFPPPNYFVGWWGYWVGTANGWYVASDENGFGGGLPRTNIAPGIGFPTGWNHPNVVSTFAACMDLGIAVYEGGGPTPVEKTTWVRIKSMFRGEDR